MSRKTKSPSDMSALLKSTSGTLAQIQQKTNSLSILSDIVRQTCPDLPEEVWNIANFKGNRVVIEVVSAIWSQRLQFERNKICQKLAEESNNLLNQIEIKVAPYRNKKVEEKVSDKPKKRLSPEAAQQLTQVAESAPDSLRKKIEKLAALANRKE